MRLPTRWGDGGVLRAIAAPYLSPRSCWLALWHVLPETKGLGVGCRLLDEMHAVATRAGSWIGGHGANQKALPIYQKRGNELREVRRWVHDLAAPLAPPASTILRPGSRVRTRTGSGTASMNTRCSSR